MQIQVGVIIIPEIFDRLDEILMAVLRRGVKIDIMSDFHGG